MGGGRFKDVSSREEKLISLKKLGILWTEKKEDKQVLGTEKFWVANFKQVVKFF